MEPKSRGLFINGKARISGLSANKNAKVADLLKLNNK
jgi:hypothetical protein